MDIRSRIEQAANKAHAEALFHAVTVPNRKRKKRLQKKIRKREWNAYIQDILDEWEDENKRLVEMCEKWNVT